MDQPDREAEPFFTQPVRQGTIMLIVLALVGFGAYVAYPRVSAVFLANPLLNGFIAFVFVSGVFACFYQIFELIGSVSWIEGFASNRPGHEMVKVPRLLAPLAALLRSRGAQMQISSTSSRSILDSVATRIDEARDITRYLGNLLIFLGLLGTFWGLATTVPAVVDTIRSLAPQEGEGPSEIFSRLMSGLEAQLGGMGVAFASSLLGLAGSLIVGLLELFANHAQNRFYQELEEWLSTITRLGFSSGDGDGEAEGEGAAAGAGIAGAILEQFAEQMQNVAGQLREALAGAAETGAEVNRLCDSLDALVAKTDAQQSLLAQVAQGVGNARTDELGSALSRLSETQQQLVAQMQKTAEEGGAHVDAESRMRLRSIDVQLLRILEEMSAGRQETLADLRNDLAALTRAINKLAKDAMVRKEG